MAWSTRALHEVTHVETFPAEGMFVIAKGEGVVYWKEEITCTQNPKPKTPN